MRGVTMDRINSFVSLLPFILSTGKDIEFSKKRIIESIIIGLFSGLLAGGAAMYVTTEVMKEKVNGVKEDISEMKASIKEERRYRREMEAKVDGIYHILIEMQKWTFLNQSQK